MESVVVIKIWYIILYGMSRRGAEDHLHSLYPYKGKRGDEDEDSVHRGRKGDDFKPGRKSRMRNYGKLSEKRKEECEEEHRA